MIGMGNRVINYVLQEHCGDPVSLLVNKTGDLFDTTTTSNTMESRLNYVLHVIAKEHVMTLGAFHQLMVRIFGD
jgi:hypothetical protein